MPLATIVADELALHLERHDSGHPDGLLFVSRQGMKIRRDKWNESKWWPAARAVGLDATYHSLRHFCEQACSVEGVSVAAVAKTLGNTPATVLKYYAHWISDDGDLVRGILDDVLSSPDHTANESRSEGA